MLYLDVLSLYGGGALHLDVLSFMGAGVVFRCFIIQ